MPGVFDTFVVRVHARAAQATDAAIRKKQVIAKRIFLLPSPIILASFSDIP
jgi:hypothetical protein